MRVLTADEMREVDRRAIEDLGVPSLILMENAAIGVADAIGERFPEVASVAVFCGPGNNGGDGFALARHLDARGYDCRVYLVIRGSRPRGDAAVQLEILEKAGFEIEELGPASDLGPALEVAGRGDLVVDALFGTGLSRPLEGHFAALVQGIDRLRVPCVAVDLPSGLDGSRPEILGPHPRAALTVTFAAPKVAHVFPPAADSSGEVVVADLGIPPFLVAEAPGSTHLLLDAELAGCLVPRPAASHKGDYGHVLIVAGAPGKAGAVILAAQAAVRGGAGLVTAAVPTPILAAVDGGSVESMTLALAATEEGFLAEVAGDQVLAAAAGKDAVALGPGLGTAGPTVRAVRRLVGELPLPLVIDADGLNALAGRLAELRNRPAPTVLTPHPGELGRLLGTPAAEIQADRPAAARRAAAESGAVVVLKGHLSLIATPDGDLFVNPTGNPGMASGGSGDVLTGLIAALLGQGYDPPTAAQLGVFLHGLAGDIALERRIRAPESLRAGDQLAALGGAFERLRQA